MDSSFTLPSFAKINWTLRILGKREDGFHELCTIYQTVSLKDVLTFFESDEISLTCSDPAVPTGDGNLVMKAVRRLQAVSRSNKGASIHLEKRIPFPGGLGGGSSNAAVTLIGLTRLWGLDISNEDLSTIAAELGSDVPFFLEGGTAVGTGRGEVIDGIPDITAENMLIVTPQVSVSTGDAFAAHNAPSLTNTASNHILRVCRSEAESLDPCHSKLTNDFEASVFSSYPEVKRVKDTLLNLGAVNAAMSGSGASVFAIFDNTETRQTAEKALDNESTWRKFAVSTVSRGLYRELLHLPGA
jgi:4-diphosphocytidyl-2-C-methyl-D-erythritol kinase